MVERFEGDLPYYIMSSPVPFLSTREVIEFAVGIDGVQGIELSALDASGLRAADAADHVAAHLDIPAFASRPKVTATEFANLLNDNNIAVMLGNYDRMYSGDDKADKKSLEYTMRVIDFAAALGGRNAGVSVGFFWGWDRTKGIRANLDSVAEKLYVLARYAEDRNVTITSENCHMPGGWGAPNEEELPQQVMRSAGSTLAGRLYITKKLLDLGIKPQTLGFIWDPSHPETEAAQALIEANESFARGENNIALHVKGHNHNVAGEDIRKAYFGGPAMPGWFATPKANETDPDGFYEIMVALGVPIGDNPWAQQYGRVTLPGVENYCATPMIQVIQTARGYGFNGPIIAENETPEKNDAKDNRDKTAIADMYSKCLEVIKPALWKGESYSGKFQPYDVKNQGVFKKQLSWDEAKAKYKLPAKAGR